MAPFTLALNLLLVSSVAVAFSPTSFRYPDISTIGVARNQISADGRNNEIKNLQNHPGSCYTSSPPLFMAAPSKSGSSATLEEIEAESEQLRQEIKELRAEALRRLEALEKTLAASPLLDSSNSSSTSQSTGSDGASISKPTEGELMPAPAKIVFSDSSKNSSKKQMKKGIYSLLDETRWKISLSIGREPGTWMPKTWGVSGQRLNLSFTVEFTPSQLFDRDDFLRGGYANAKILNIVNNEVTLGPSISEGQRVYKVKEGGWQVTQGDGPLGTDLLRFFIELDDEVSHTGGDVYVPKGRVYCSCGYFPFLKSGGDEAPSMKEAFKNELKKYDEKIEELRQKKAEIKNPFSLEGIQISREIFRLNRQAERAVEQLSFAQVREPDKSLLRFSRDGDVGLTKEGGVCCRVDKGLATEYHILGRFSVASAEKD